MIKLGQDAQLNHTSIDTIIYQTRSALGQWRKLAKEHGVSQINIHLIAKRHSSELLSNYRTLKIYLNFRQKNPLTSINDSLLSEIIDVKK